MDKNCEKYRDLFYLGVGKDLPSELQQDLTNHLDSCADCRQEYAKIEKMNGIFADVRTNLSKIEDCTNLDKIRERNINLLKSKLNKPKRIKLTFLRNPIAAAILILIISLSVVIFPNSRKPMIINTSTSYTASNPTTSHPETDPNVVPTDTVNLVNIDKWVTGEIQPINFDNWKKNDIYSNFHELKMKCQGNNQGHNTQDSSIKVKDTVSYLNPTARVEVGNNEEGGAKPIGFKPTQTKIVNNFDENNPKNDGFK